MRIIGGKYKGKKFNPPKSFKSRPTTDFAKEALFTILQNNFNFENVDVLDLFSGTGSISYEFCSRGCRNLMAIEKVTSYTKYIQSMFDDLEFDQAEIRNADVFKFLNSCSNKFDIIFADPPFDMPDYDRVYHLVLENQLLSDTSFLIIEHSENQDFSKFEHFLMLKKYGKVHFSFFDPMHINKN